MKNCIAFCLAFDPPKSAASRRTRSEPWGFYKTMLSHRLLVYLYFIGRGVAGQLSSRFQILQGMFARMCMNLVWWWFLGAFRFACLLAHCNHG
jgi:hypothetical protein